MTDPAWIHPDPQPPACAAGTCTCPIVTDGTSERHVRLDPAPQRYVALRVRDLRWNCCPHCKDDVIHDVPPKDGHDLPCDICDRDAPAYKAGWAAAMAKVESPAIRDDTRRQAAQVIADRWLADGVDAEVDEHALVEAFAAALAEAEARGEARIRAKIEALVDDIEPGRLDDPPTNDDIRAIVCRLRAAVAPEVTP